MAVIDPTSTLSDLAEMFADGAAKPDGLTFDPELCAAMADGLAEAGEAMRILTQLAEEAGLVERLRHAALPAPRTPVARRLLAASTVSLDPERRVVAFPVRLDMAPALTSGGSAA